MDPDTSRRGIRQWWFAFPEGQNGWRIYPGEVELIDGLYHKLQFFGFETRSGESFGISATFHVLESIYRDADGCYGPIQKIILQNGRLVSYELVGPKERVIVQHADESLLVRTPEMPTSG